MKSYKPLAALFILLLLAATIIAGDTKKEAAIEQPADPAKPEIKWLSYDEGLAKAKKEGKHLFIDFTAKWCGYCKKMDASTFIEPDVVNLINSDFIPVKIDGDSEKELNIDGYKVTERSLSRQEYKVRGFPTFWFLDENGAKLGAVQGFQPASNLLATLQYVKDKKYVTDAEEKAEAKKEVQKETPDNN